MANVSVVGIGAMGGGIARSLLASSSTRTVSAYDVNASLVCEFYNEARSMRKASSSPSSGGERDEPPCRLSDVATSDTNAVVLVLVNEGQCERVCFGEGEENLLDLLAGGSCVILCSTVTATWAKKAAERFSSRGIHFVDCPISGGPARARNGSLALMTSGDDASLSVASPLLRAIGKDMHIIPGGAGMGSTAKMVHQLLAGAHVACAAEALALAAKAGIDVRQMYRIVSGAAGMSWMFGDRGARMMGERPPTVMSAADIFVKDLSIVRSEAKAVRAPVPVAAAALQQFVAAQGLGLGRFDDSQVVKVYEVFTGVPVGGTKAEPAAAAEEIPSDGEGGAPLHVSVVGIGAMGGGIARALLRSTATRTVVGYDRAESLALAFYEESKLAGKTIGDAAPRSLAEAVSDQTSAVMLVLVNESQCDEVCFGQHEENLLSLLNPGSCVILCSTVTATWARRAEKMFGSKGILFVDCPISGGPARAKSGHLTMMASGNSSSLKVAMPLLRAAGSDVHIIPGGAGFGSTVKMVHQLLAGVHVVCAAEALALAAKTGIDTKQMYDIVNGAAGASWMFADRGKRMINTSEPEVMSAVNIFVKDLDIVVTEANSLSCPVPIVSAALQQFISAQGIGLGRKDDSQVIKVYEQVTGVPVGK